jgi:hypothetical protein
MIPEFPEFKNLELSDRKDIDHITLRYDPYSDFNFTSMWGWNVNNKTLISKFKQNLIVKFTDYLDGSMFYSFIGHSNQEECIDNLLKLSEREGLGNKLKLIPYDSINNIQSQNFLIEEERDHFDYILDNNKLVKYEGRPLRGHASFKKRFTELHSNCINLHMLDLGNENHQQHMVSLNELWVKNKIKESKTVTPGVEDKVIKRIFDLCVGNTQYNLVALFDGEKLIAFTIDESLKDGHSIRHIMKADTSYKGIYSFLISESARVLLETGIKYTNVEQDLGLPNLRQSKKSFQPAYFLKKYTVSRG